MANWTKANLRTQFNRAAANGWIGAFTTAARQHNLPIDVLIAIASRESNMRNVVGDGGHGYSLMQIDDRSFAEWIKAGHWKDPNAAIDMGAHVLHEKRREVANLGVRSGGILSQINSEEAEADLMRTAIAAYNCGSTRAYNNLVKYGDPDRGTTGKDYSADVLKRAEAFRGFYGEWSRDGDPRTFISNDISDLDSATPTPAETSVSPSTVQSGTVSPVDGPPAPVQTVQTDPPVVEVKSTGVSWQTKIGAALAPIGTFFTAVGIKVGGVELTQGVILAILGAFTISAIVGAWVWNEGKKREQERLRWSMENLADRGKNNVVASGSSGS